MKVQFTGWPAFVLFLAVFLTVYAPVLVTSYAFYDDYADLAAALQGDISGTVNKKIAEGRPLSALLTSSLTVARDIGDLRYVRLLGIVGIAALAWGVFRLLVRIGWSPVRSFFVCVILCTTLPFQVYAAWAIAAFNVFAALASGLAFVMGERAFDEQKPLPKWLLAAGASLVLLVALTIYQPAAMFFWVFAAVTLLKPDTPLCAMLRRFGWYCLIVFVGMLLGFVVYKLSSALYPGDLGRGDLVQNIPAKIFWFLLAPFRNALNIGLLSPAHWLFSEGSPVHSLFHKIIGVVIAWSVFSGIVGGLMLYWQGTLKERLGKLGVALALPPLSYAPNLLVAADVAAYRSLSVLTSVVVVYAFFAFHGYLRHWRRLVSPFWVNTVMGSVALASGLSATYHLQTYFVAPQVQELEIMRSHLAQGNLVQVRGIHVIRSGWQDTLAPLVRYDEFGFPSSASWAARAMVFLLLCDTDYADLPVTVVAANDRIDPPPDSLVVDMGKLLRQAQRDDSGP